MGSKGSHPNQIWNWVTRTITGLAAGVITATSIASNAITAAKIATDAITAAKIATDAIGADEFAQAAADKVWDTGTRTLTAGPAPTVQRAEAALSDSSIATITNVTISAVTLANTWTRLHRRSAVTGPIAVYGRLTSTTNLAINNPDIGNPNGPFANYEVIEW